MDDSKFKKQKPRNLIKTQESVKNKQVQNPDQQSNVTLPKRSFHGPGRVFENPLSGNKTDFLECFSNDGAGMNEIRSIRYGNFS